MTTNRIEERYSLKEFDYYESIGDDELVVYRKPKRVKVTFSSLHLSDEFYAVRFKIENWSGDKFSVHHTEKDFSWHSVTVGSLFVRTVAHGYVSLHDTRCPLYIGQDAQGKWSTPVIFNQEQREKLQDLCKYLEDKLNAPS